MSARASQRLSGILEESVRTSQVPFVVAAVTDKNGTIWEGSAGLATPTLKASQDIVFPLYSATKALASLSPLIMIDRGKLSFDTRVVDVLPEFQSVKVLDQITAAGPVFQEPDSPVTLRQLMTHTYRQASDNWNAKQKQWMAWSKTPASDMLRPMTFQPGTGWTYGPGMAWHGMAWHGPRGWRKKSTAEVLAS